MRFVYALIAIAAWLVFLDYCFTNGAHMSDEVTMLTISIVAAGALSGGE